MPSSEPALMPDEMPPGEDPVPGPADSVPIGTDPTLAHAGMTELDDSAAPYTNGVSGGHNDVDDIPTAPSATAIDADGATNAAGGANWENKMSDSWVDVQPRDPTETDPGFPATPAGLSGTQSWAEDVPSHTTPLAAPGGGDGFHEVHHGREGRGRGSGRGAYQGEGRGRGRPFRGDRAGEGGGYRGRGGYRGHRDGGDGGGFRGRGGRGRGGGGRGRGGDGSFSAPHGVQGGGETSQW